jgi:hypothetical protein
MNISLIRAALTCIIVIFSSSSAHAEEKKTKSRVCNAAISVFERLHDIPKGLLHAISETESQKHPWSVNRGGESYYFDSQEEAVKFVKESGSKGHSNIDVGCMQINLFYHGNKFKTIDEAFHPITNINYAAIFLKELYLETGSWKNAIRYYHSRDAKFNQPYLSKVMSKWSMASL